MTPPIPPPGYELVEDEPRHKDLVWFLEGWRRVGKELVVLFGTGDNPIAADARDLRWIARKI